MQSRMDTQQLTLIGHQITVERAVTLAEQQHGLAGRDTIAPDRGMLFLYDDPLVPTFWMKDMRFPIDIVWLRSGKVVGIESNLPADDGAQTYHPASEVDAVLELAAGQAQNLGLVPGSPVTY